MTFTLALSLLTTPHAEGAACGAWVVWLPQPWLHTIAEAQLPLLCCAMNKASSTCRVRRGINDPIIKKLKPALLACDDSCRLCVSRSGGNHAE